MLTFFTTAKAFRGHSTVIQRNALKSWTLLHPDVEIILFGDDEGAAETARELGIRHEPHVERTEGGLNRLDYMLATAEVAAHHDIFCYINCDIMLMEDFCRALERVRAAHSQFLMVGRRWDTEISELVDFARPDWHAHLRRTVRQRGKQRTPEWIDYFAFTRGLYDSSMPPFVVGRAHFDHWLVWKALDSKRPVVDVSASVMAVHQNHDYSHHALGRPGTLYDSEARRNHQLAGGWKRLRTIADATEVLGEKGLKPNRARHLASAMRHLRQAGRVLRHDLWEPIWFLLLGLTRPVRRRMGLRRRCAEPAIGNHE
jgi:hypothetical protein